MSAISTASVLTRQFYEWEQRGRGWYCVDETVALEPRFVPFFGHYVPGDIIDDGKRPSFWQSLFGDIQSQPSAQQTYSYDIAFPWADQSPLTIYAVSLPRNSKFPATHFEQLFAMLSYRKCPISFEVVATGTRIAFQWTCREADEDFLYSQLKAFFPDVSIRETYEDAIEALLRLEAVLYTVDFGLQEEFLRPLAVHTSSDHDPYTAFFGMCDQLTSKEQVALQVLFAGTHNPWAESMLCAATDESGKNSFFADDPDMPRLTKEKTASPLFGVAVRMVTAADTLERSGTLLHHAATALVHASRSPSNCLMPLKENTDDPAYPIGQRLADMLLRETHRVGMLLNSGELATLIHYPGNNIRSAKLYHTTRHTTPPPPQLIGKPYVLGVNEHQGVRNPIGITADQRLRHLHIIGATGTGKSTILQTLMMQDVHNGAGFMCIDPHGDVIDALLSYIPENRISDVVLIDPSDAEYPVAFNMLAAHSDLERELLASDLVALFRRFSTSWGDQMNSVLANALLALLYNTKTFHIGDLRRFLIEASYRAQILTTVTDPDITYYWQHEFSLLKGGAIGSIITRLDSFLRPKVIRHMVCQDRGLDIRALMDSKKIILVKLAQGLIGTENSYLLGACLVSKIQQTAMARQAQPADTRIPFYCYIDEFQHVITPSMATILSGARKYGVGLVLVHQDLQQVSHVDPIVANALMANAGTRICFRLGDTDAKRLQEGFTGFNAEDFQNLAVGDAILRVNTADCVCTVSVEPYHSDQNIPYTADIIAHSRNTYAKVPLSPAAQSDIPQTTPVPAAPPQTAPVPQETTPKEIREHRYLQSFIKKIAEQYGYKAGIEVPTPDGAGLVDVLLEKDGQSIAVEISVTTGAEWEMHNIDKCLLAGYSRILVCTNDAQKLKRIRTLVAEQISEDKQAVITVLTADDLATTLQTAISTQPQDTVIKGYRVKVSYDANASRQHILSAIAARGKKG